MQIGQMVEEVHCKIDVITDSFDVAGQVLERRDEILDLILMLINVSVNFLGKLLSFLMCAVNELLRLALDLINSVPELVKDLVEFTANLVSEPGLSTHRSQGQRQNSELEESHVSKAF